MKIGGLAEEGAHRPAPELCQWTGARRCTRAERGPQRAGLRGHPPLGSVCRPCPPVLSSSCGRAAGPSRLGEVDKQHGGGGRGAAGLPEREDQDR